MSTWTSQELDKVGAADEVRVAVLRPDGTAGSATTIWAVRVGDELYVRSYRGRDSGWFRRALATGQGRLQTDDLERAVRFQEPAHDTRDAVDQAVDQAYRAKYARYGAGYLTAMTAPVAVAATLQLVPR